MKATTIQQIIDNNQLKSVYQPIVSLRDGSVLGYEALARTTNTAEPVSIEELFVGAGQIHKLWELEYLCRKNALAGIGNGLGNRKIFLNVDPYVMYDDRFREGMTQTYLEQYGISAQNVVFEITERTNIQTEDINVFREMIRHYRRERYEIAVDDFGKACAGIQRVVELKPQFVKIDMDLIRDIHLAPGKESVLEGILKFCQPMGIQLIAEGIESREELVKLIRLGIHYGQGYYIARPAEQPPEPPEALVELICREYDRTRKHKQVNSFFADIHAISSRGGTVSQDAQAILLYEHMKQNPQIEELCVVDEEQRVCGLLTQHDMWKHFGGQYGYALNRKKLVREIMNTDFLAVDWHMSIETVAKMAMMRPKKRVYDIVVVLKEERYYGVITIKDLLQAAINIQVERATDANPLTHLPGNQCVQEEIERALAGSGPYAILYMDLDNFKAYNDVYGFENGDLMIRTVADAMRRVCVRGEFLGHIGGDDFVIVARHYDLQEVFRNITAYFQQRLPQLYTAEDYEKGAIVSCNRSGVKENFPLVSLSGAMVTNQYTSVTCLDEFSHIVAGVKKQSKQICGNSMVVYDVCRAASC